MPAVGLPTIITAWQIEKSATTWAPPSLLPPKRLASPDSVPFGYRQQPAVPSPSSGLKKNSYSSWRYTSSGHWNRSVPMPNPEPVTPGRIPGWVILWNRIFEPARCNCSTTGMPTVSNYKPSKATKTIRMPARKPPSVFGLPFPNPRHWPKKRCEFARPVVLPASFAECP